MEAIMEAGAAAAAVVLVAVARVEIRRGEGWAGDVMPRAVFEGPDAVARAESRLRAWAQTAPKGGAYDKCDVCVTWADGATEALRYDLHHPTYARVDLAGELRNEVGMRAGTWGPPAGVRAEAWRRFREEMGYAGAVAAAAAEFLATHAI